MGADIDFPRKFLLPGYGGTVVGRIRTDSLGPPVSGTCSGTAQTNGADVTLTLNSTTTTAATAAGATSITLASTAGLQTGSIVRIIYAGFSGTTPGDSSLLAEISLAGNVATLFEPRSNVLDGTGVPITLTSSLPAGTIVAPGFVRGDHVRIAGAGPGGTDLDTLISVVSSSAPTITIVGRPGLPTTVTNAAITRHYAVETRQIARRVILERLTGAYQRDEWDERLGMWQGRRFAESGAVTMVTSGGMLVLANRIVIPFDLLPASSEFSLTLQA